MFQMLTTSLALLAAFSPLALADVTVTVTETLTYSSYGADYTTTSQSTYTTDTTPSAITTSSTTTSPTTTHSIQVGPGGQLVYSPSNISANVGDTVQFFFNPKNHTVTQSSFTVPCKKLAASTGQVGLDSEFTNPTNVSLTSVGFSFVVNGTTPLWFYCRQTGHCTKGMVFAVNANSNKTFDAFLSNALNSNSSSSSATPSSGSGGSTGSATDSGATSSSTSSASNSNNAAISTSVNVGLTAFLAAIGGFILAL